MTGFGAGGRRKNLDKFGITQIVPTKEGGQEWFINMNNPTSDSRFVPQVSIVRNADGSYKVTGETAVRMYVPAQSSYQSPDTYTHATWESRGYMIDSNDWKNVEITGFFKINTITAGQEAEDITLFARGGKHQASNGGCEGSSLKGSLTYSGNARWSKEQQHTDGYTHKSFTNGVCASLVGRWVGLKAVIYNNNAGNVVCRLYLNDTADRETWTLIDEKIDDGTWGTQGALCGNSSAAAKMTWGGSLVHWRLDEATDFDFKWFSCREIAPPS